MEVLLAIGNPAGLMDLTTNSCRLTDVTFSHEINAQKISSDSGYHSHDLRLSAYKGGTRNSGLI